MGKGGSSDGVDKAYNARMATIAEQQQAMANEYMDFWRNNYQGMEKAQIDANMQLIPKETAFQLAQIDANQQLLPQQTALQLAQIGSQQQLIPQQTALQLGQIDAQKALLPQQQNAAMQFYNAASKGVNVNERMNQAQADVINSMKGQTAAMNRDFSRAGMNINSGAYANAAKMGALEMAKASAGARTQARTGAETENFNRLAAAGQTAMGGIYQNTVS